jgi:hypothetical protein
MANKFDALRVKMSPAAHGRAAQRAQAMLAEMPPQEAETYGDDRTRESDQTEAEQGRGPSPRGSF